MNKHISEDECTTELINIPMKNQMKWGSKFESYLKNCSRTDVFGKRGY